jgi:peptide methionine sulfoxide reductase MsrA
MMDAVLIAAVQPAYAEITPVYFGNGCFWGRQKDFIDTEMTILGRDTSASTAVVGYAGGKENSKSTCYYYNAPGTLYERQGHAEVVQVGVDSSKASYEMAIYAETYFSQFNRTLFGMERQVRNASQHHSCTRCVS